MWFLKIKKINWKASNTTIFRVERSVWTIFVQDFIFFHFVVLMLLQNIDRRLPLVWEACIYHHAWGHMKRIFDLLHIICHQIGKCHTVQNKKSFIDMWNIISIKWHCIELVKIKLIERQSLIVSREEFENKRYFSKFPKFPDLGAKLALL